MKAVPDSLSFKSEGFQKHIADWNKANHNALDFWLKEGLMVGVEEWHFVSLDNLRAQQNILDRWYELMDLKIVALNNLQEEIKFNCRRKTNEINEFLNKCFDASESRLVTRPLFSLCPKIIEQPLYILESIAQYPETLDKNKQIFYRYNYLKVKLEFGNSKFQEYVGGLNKIIRNEVSNRQKGNIQNLFLFMEQFIDVLNDQNVSGFKYFISPLFRILFKEVMNLKGYYIEVFDSFNFQNINKVEKLLSEEELCSKKSINTYSKCSSTTFKYDITELCENCPIPLNLNKDIQNQIISKAKERRDILDATAFRKYLNDEIESAVKAMEKAEGVELLNKTIINDPNRHNRIEVYIWNKERIKALKSFLVGTEKIPSQGLPEYIEDQKINPNDCYSDVFKNPEINSDDLFYKNRKIIMDEMDFVKKHFLTENDYNEFVSILANYFSGGKYNAGLSFKLKRNKKTIVASVFNHIHKQLGVVDVLKKDIKYLNIIKMLEPFKGASDIEIYKAITR